MHARGVKVIAITNLAQSRSSTSRHSSGKKLYEIAEISIDNCVPAGDALLTLAGLASPIGPSSTVAGAAIINSIIIEAVVKLLHRGEQVPVLPSANIEGVSEESLRLLLNRYQGRIRYLDVNTVGPELGRSEGVA